MVVGFILIARTNYSSVYFNLHIFGTQVGKWWTLDWMVDGIPGVQPTLSFFKHIILIGYGSSQISELRHTLKGFIT